jgi:DNA-binding MarR family transcriptional regulator
MAHTTRPQLPIGYWIKQADNTLTAQINAAQSAHGVSRFEWQTLNTLKETGGARREQIFETMHTFADEPGLAEILRHLSERGWIEQRASGEFQLTEEGQQQHDVIFATQREVRQRAMQGISEEDYATAVRVLHRIVTNLGGEGQG